MSALKFEEIKESLKIQVNIDKLNAQQIRLIKSIVPVFMEILTTSKEEVLFNQSKEFLRIWATMVKLSSFVELESKNAVYADQALEFALDEIIECIKQKNFIQLDN